MKEKYSFSHENKEEEKKPEQINGNYGFWNIKPEYIEEEQLSERILRLLKLEKEKEEINDEVNNGQRHAS